MRALVVGGSGSGKSAFAERLACSLSMRRTYLATMEPHGAEARERIERHRAQRADLGFTTLECVGSLPPCVVSPDDGDGVILLDDLGNLVANALFSPEGRMHDPTAVLGRLEREVCALAASHRHVVVVGNHVGSEGRPPDETTLCWVRLMGALCCRLATRFDTVVEVVAGIPCVVRGALP